MLAGRSAEDRASTPLANSTSRPATSATMNTTNTITTMVYVDHLLAARPDDLAQLGHDLAEEPTEPAEDVPLAGLATAGRCRRPLRSRLARSHRRLPRRRPGRARGRGHQRGIARVAGYIARFIGRAGRPSALGSSLGRLRSRRHRRRRQPLRRSRPSRRRRSVTVGQVAVGHGAVGPSTAAWSAASGVDDVASVGSAPTSSAVAGRRRRRLVIGATVATVLVAHEVPSSSRRSCRPLAGDRRRPGRPAVVPSPGFEPVSMLVQGRQDLNLQPAVLETAALPVELRPSDPRSARTSRTGAPHGTRMCPPARTQAGFAHPGRQV